MVEVSPLPFVIPVLVSPLDGLEGSAVVAEEVVSDGSLLERLL